MDTKTNKDKDMKQINQNIKINTHYDIKLSNPSIRSEHFKLNESKLTEILTPLAGRYWNHQTGTLNKRREQTVRSN